MRSRSRILAAVLATSLLAPATASSQDAPATQPEQPPARALPEDRPWSDEELAEIKEIEKDVAIYEGASLEHQARLKKILRREYEQRLAEINKKYRQGCVNSYEARKLKRKKSQQQLEAFLDKYPDNPDWTPDVMFRLAQLYYYQLTSDWNEQTGDMPCAAIGGVQIAQNTNSSGALGPDFTPALSLWRRIITDFPGYRMVDSTIYLMAFVTGESPPYGMGQPDDAKPIWLGLVCRNKYDPLAAPPPPPADGKLPPCLPPSPDQLKNDPYAGCEPYKQGSRLNDEAWVRIGDAHFNARCELPEAIAAYKQVAGREDSEYYDNALYMLAWSYYRFNQYEDAILTFDKFVVLSDKKEAEGKGQFDLRKEGVQYLAISFADPRPGEALSNPVDAVKRINAFYKDKGRIQEKHVRDVYEELGDVIKLNAGTPAGDGPLPDDMYVAYDKAIEMWLFAIDNFPLHPRNPEIHQKIIDLLELMGDKDREVKERKRVAELYKKGSDWYGANEMNREAMEAANRLSENSLIKAAVAMQRRASSDREAWEVKQAETYSALKKKKQPGLPATFDEYLLTVQNDPGRKAYQETYQAAAQLYEQYLVTYPTSASLYDLTMNLAECYFYAWQFDDAVKHYAWVRDHRNMGGGKFTDKAIKRIVESRRTAVDLALAANPPTLVEPPDPTQESLAKDATKKEIPVLWQNLQKAFDEYAVWVPGDPDASSLALEAALISYRHLDLDDALVRFEKVLNNFCNTPEATQAKEGLLVIYGSRGENEKFEATNDRFIKKGCGTAGDREIAEAQNRSLAYKTAKKKFDEAKALQKSGQNAQAMFLEAGQMFYGYYALASKKDPDRDDALFAAAVAYSEAGRPKTAISLYAIFIDDPAFRDSEYYIEALFLIAQNHKNAFEYEKAADKFMQVYRLASGKNVKAQASFDVKQARLDALYNAAYLKDVDRFYFDRNKNDLGAVTLYKQYAKEEPDKVKASDGFFKVALIYKKVGKDKDMLATFDTWRKTHAKDPTVAPSVCLNYVMSFYEAARLAKGTKAQKKAWAEVITAYDKCFNDAVAARHKEKAQKAYEDADLIAREWGGEAQFRLSEFYYKENFEPYKFKWRKLSLKDPAKNEAAIIQSFTEMADLHEKTIREYLKIIRFNSSWGLAAAVRIGDVSYFTADKIYAAGMPKLVEDLAKKYPDYVDEQGRDLIGAFSDTVDQVAQDQYIRPTDEKNFPFGAEKYWKLAVETAKKAGNANEWSRLAEQRLNTYIASDQYPVQRDDITKAEDKP